MVDLHLQGERQGPGSEEATLLALKHSHVDKSLPLHVADIGCGTGASTLVLAKNLPNASITAVDLFPEFLSALTQRAKEMGLAEKVTTVQGSMESLPFATDSLDMMWSEGAIYNIGFKNGIEQWKPFLKDGGILAVSEITWLHLNPPKEIQEYWETEYPEISTAPEKIKTLENAGYDLLGYSVLPPSNWINNYYEPTASRIADFLSRHAGAEEAKEIVSMEQAEAQLYQKYQNWFSYGFYVARKR